MDELVRLGFSYFPLVMTGELILGYIYRCILASRVQSRKKVMQILVGRTSVHPPWMLPTNLKWLANCLSSVFVSGAEILNNHTCLPAHFPFIKPERLTSVLAAALEGASAQGVITALGTQGRRKRSTVSLFSCLKCILEDRVRTGIAYWHREHAVPGVYFCFRHGTALMQGCGRCKFSKSPSDHLLLPDCRCWCGEALVPVIRLENAKDARILKDISRYAAELLNGALSGRTAREVGQYFAYRVHVAGYGKDNHIDRDAFSEAVKEKYTSEVLRSLDSSVRESSWISEMIGRRLAPSQVGRNLLLFHFFGGLPGSADFKQADAHWARLDKQVPPVTVMSEESIVITRERRRRSFLAVLVVHGSCSRRELAGRYSKLVAWLSKNDRAWYEAHAPKSRRGKCRKYSSREEQLASMDEAASDHVNSRAQELMKTASIHPVMLTKQVLLSGFPSGNHVTYAALRSMPKTRTAIEKAIVSHRLFEERVAVLLLRKFGPLAVDKAVKEICRRTNLSKSKVFALNTKLLRRGQA